MAADKQDTISLPATLDTPRFLRLQRAARQHRASGDQSLQEQQLESREGSYRCTGDLQP